VADSVSDPAKMFWAIFLATGDEFADKRGVIRTTHIFLEWD
jgi:hypothetical protein